MISFIKAKYKYIIPAIHFLLSFLYERRILIFKLDRDIIATIAKSNIISDSFERFEGYLFAKIFAFIFIFFLWKLIFWTADNIKETYVKVFVAVAIAGCILFGLMWPYPFDASVDNYITYSYALRFWPEYWHSAYTSFIFTACLMVLPFSRFIGIFQWIFAVFVMGYAYKRAGECDVLPAKSRFFMPLTVILPGTFTLVSNSYRTELYTLLCIWFVSKIVFDMLDKKPVQKYELIKFMLVCGLISVWRSEGAILGLLGFGVYLIFVLKHKPVKVVLLSAAMTGVFLIFFMPQKLGDMKYYGKDYSFINSFVNLQNILNTEGSNLTYDGAERDMAAFDAVTPILLLKSYGMDGYRRYNYANGRHDYNQSLASDEVAAEYMRAYYNLLKHNPGLYIKTQYSLLATVLMVSEGPYFVGYYDWFEGDLPKADLEAWDIGREDMAATNKEIGISAGLYEGVSRFCDSVSSLFARTYAYSLLLIGITLYQVYIFFAEIIKACRKKDNLLGFAGLSFVLLLQAFAIVLVLPYPSLVYFHAYYYATFIQVLAYTLYKFANRKTERTL